MITAKIDVTKIDKARLFKGEKGTYLDICLIETPNDNYGNSHMVVQSVTKEERAAGKKGAILGNAKTFGQAQQHEQRAPSRKPSKPAPEENLDEDVPF